MSATPHNIAPPMHFDRLKDERPALWAAMIRDRCLLGEEMAIAGFAVFPWIEGETSEARISRASTMPGEVADDLAQFPDAGVGILCDGYPQPIDATDHFLSLHLDDFLGIQRRYEKQGPAR